MTRAEAIKQLDGAEVMLLNREFEPFQQAIIMAINSLREQEQSGWISVNERLPDLIPCNAGTAYSDAVIVWTDGKKAMIAVWDGIDFLCPTDYWEAWGENITHWMPLPTPPKEGKP